jgi:hypothetical protein
MYGLRGSAFFAALAAMVFSLVFSSGELQAVQVLGTGTASLVGNDLTDPENDGVETLYAPPGDFGGFDATFFSSDEPGFGGGEFAFNVFDNILGPGNDKWCCGTVFPQIVGADFRDTQGLAFRLTHFTVSSAEDTMTYPERHPIAWTIEGSNDGDCWTTIFSLNDLSLACETLGIVPGTPIWTDNLQVIRFDEGDDYDTQTAAYSMFRMVTTQTGSNTGAFFQIGEIEFFGEEGDPPTNPECNSCATGVTDIACHGGGGQDFVISWKNSCDCPDPLQILVNDVEVGTVAKDATTYTIPAASVPTDVFAVKVVNCSGVPSLCTVFKTDVNGSIIGTGWLALGPFATPVACDGDATKFTTNLIGPEESVACQFPVDGDPVEGYVPGDPLVPDPSTASTSGYNALSPVDGLGNPVWRLFTDLTPLDGDLNFEQGPAGPVDQQVQFVATWIENKAGMPLDLQACFASDDDGQVWLDDQLIHNAAACRGRALCQTTFFFTLPTGIHVIKVGVFEEGGDWGTLFGLVDPVTGLPIFDLGGILDADELTLGSPVSGDIVFHGTTRPAPFVEPDCSGVVCLPVTNLICTKNDDGTIDMSWENPLDCEHGIRILAGTKEVAVLAPGTTTYTIEDETLRLTAMVSVDNGSYSIASCSLVTVLGLGAGFLLGSDLTDIDNDGVEASYAPPADYGGFDATFFSSDEEGFNDGIVPPAVLPGEAAFNVFDNMLDVGNAKWCCGTTFPQIVGADFTDTLSTAYLLTHFTVSSANDAPERDPRVWRIEGSNDGETWTTIFSQDNPNAPLWTDRLQVLLFQEDREFPVQTEAYAMFRMVTDLTGAPGGDPLVAFFQIGEIEFFGEEGGTTREICDNGIDDDGDQLTDCADPSCGTAANCQGKKFYRADPNNDGATNITDGIYILNFLFLGGPAPTCRESADPNNDKAVNITDGIYVLNYLFLGGPAPTFPGPPGKGEPCGLDTDAPGSAGDLGCDTYTKC